MQSHWKSSIDCPAKCRPLLITLYQQNQQSLEFLSLPYNYQINDVKTLQTYLCSSIKVMGVDFQGKQLNLPKLKYAYICFGGLNKQNIPIKIKNPDDYLKVDWILNIVIPISSTISPNIKQIKKYLLDNLMIFQKEKQSPIDSELISFASLKNALLYCGTTYPKSLQTQNRKIFMNTIPVSILLPKRQNYQKNKILQMLSDDISSSISVMVTNQLYIRKVDRHQSLIPIQNYYKCQEQKDVQFEKLIKKTYKIRTDRQPLSSSPINASGKQKKPIQDPIKLLFLVLALILLVGGYALIKFL